MDEHIHTGFIVFVATGVYAILFIHAVRFAAAKLVQHPSTETIGKALGATVHFG